jgi:hypothetical protein
MRMPAKLPVHERPRTRAQPSWKAYLTDAEAAELEQAMQGLNMYRQLGLHKPAVRAAWLTQPDDEGINGESGGGGDGGGQRGKRSQRQRLYAQLHAANKKYAQLMAAAKVREEKARPATAAAAPVDEAGQSRPD